MSRTLPLRRRPANTDSQITRIAAIDIGSNSIRQLIADVSAGGSIKVVDEMKDAPRLGAGLAESGALSEEAMGRAIEALGRMALLAKQARATRIEAVATSAVRDAANGRTFLARVKRATGLDVRLLSGEQEARLSFLSAMAHFDLAVGRAVVMDIGGGSLELALSAGGVVDRLLSFPLGTVRLTERFLGMTPRRGDVAALRKEVRRELRAHWRAREWRRAQVIGAGGTFTNVAGMVLARQGQLTARTVHATRVERYDEPHARHVRELALQLFDALGERLGCQPADRQLLGDAALLHDIGYHISYDTHHKHSYHLILHADLLGISPSDQVVLANVARYHRGALPKRSQRNYGSLDKDSRRRVKRLAALLRIADGLDRGHVGAVERVKVRWSARSLRITPQPAAPGGTLRLELWGASRRQSLLEKVAGVPVEFVDADGAVYGESELDVPDVQLRAIR